jgi:hypothetical protein
MGRKRRVGSCRPACQERNRLPSGRVDLVARCSPCQIVAEPSRQLVRIASTPDPREERDVVEGDSIFLRQAQGVAQTHCNQSLAQDVLYGLTKA